MLESRLEEKNMSVYQCSKLSGVPYTTMLELVKGKTKIKKCSAETVYKLSKILGTTVEELIEESEEYRLSFEAFKSNVCHMVKDMGDVDFIVNILQSDDISCYWNKMWYREAFYLLAMVDYLSRVNDIPLCTKYNEIRSRTLDKTIYPRDIEMAARLFPSLDVKEQCKCEAIPEFMRFNIVESEIRNVH